MFAQQFEKDLLFFLNQEKILNDLEIVALEYEKNIKKWQMVEKFPPPFRFHFKLDIEKIKHFSGNLHRLIIKEPVIAFDLIQNIIYCALVLIVVSFPLEKSDLQIAPLIINLPITNEISHLLLHPSYELESVQGMLVSTTSIASYVRSSFYKCETVCCPKNRWKRYSENMTNCPDCFGTMKKHTLSADMGEEIICQFLSTKIYHATGRFQALPIKIKDELCTAVDFHIGEEYIVTGNFSGKYFLALNLQPVIPESLSYSDLPQSISSLRFEISQTRNACPWSFVIAISSLLASYILPLSSFLNLKIGLMLSLATMKNESPVPIVAVGSDTLNTQILFQAAGKFTDKYVNHSPSSSVLGGVMKSGLQSDVICQEGGQLILATRGVCNLGDWSKYRKEQSNYICQTLESGQIFFNNSKCAKTNQTNFVPLKCCVWTYWRPSGKNLSQKSQLKTLTNVFGIPFLAEEKNETELIKICWKNINSNVKNFQPQETSTVISNKDFKEFFEIINSKEVELTDMASQLIRNYFVINRKDKHHCLPLRAIKTITSLAEAHARLALRDEILCEDVIGVIYLYEEVLSSFYGKSLVPFERATWDENETIYEWMSKQIREFGMKLTDCILN